MIKRFIIFFGILLYLVNSFAVQSIEEQMSLYVRQGICQSEWFKSPHLRRVYHMEKYRQKIHLRACATWATNTSYVAFLEVQGTDEILFVPLTFIRHSNSKGLYSDVVINIDALDRAWSQESLTIEARRNINGNSWCGERALYEWDPNLQFFKALSISKNDDCSNQKADWEEVLSQE